MWKIYAIFSAISALTLASPTDFTSPIRQSIVLSDGVAFPDCFAKSIHLVNGSMPGPTLRVQHGRPFHLNVTNNLDAQGASIHLHGFLQTGSPQYDGVAMGTQMPIPAGESMEYLMAPITNAPGGTYYYHSHYKLSGESIFGAAIVEDLPEDQPYKYADERIVILSDYFHASDVNQTADLQKPLPAWKWIGDPQSLLINGEGVFNCQNVTAPDSCGVETSGRRGCRHHVIDVEPNKTYRFRFIGATTMSYLSVNMTGHKMTVIEVDGMYTQPYDVDTLEISSGQRYSVLVHTNSASIGTLFAINAGIRWRKAGPVGLGFIRYQKATITDVGSLDTGAPLCATELQMVQPAIDASKAPLITPNSTVGWILPELRPLQTSQFNYWYNEISMNVTRQIILTGRQSKVLYDGPMAANMSGFNASAPLMIIKWTINNVAYMMPQNETMLMDAVKSKSMNSPVVYEIAKDDLIEVVLQNSVAQNGVCEHHPWHLHGHHFYDMGAGPGNHSEMTADDLDKYISKAPIMRDSTTLYPWTWSFSQQPAPNATVVPVPGEACGWRVVRFVADNPGLWMMHCHISAHMQMGMQIFFVEQKPQLQQLMAAAGFQGMATSGAVEPFVSTAALILVAALATV